MVLAFTLVILLLMSLMGMTIMLNSRTELSISSNASLNRNAFASADTAARLATLIGRIILHPELGDPEQILDNVLSGGGALKFPLKVEININPNDLLQDSSSYIYTKRYLRAGSGGTEEPDIVFKSNGVVVATAALALDHEDASQAPAGASLGGGDAYDGGGGPSLSIVLAVSVNGRAVSQKVTGSEAFVGGGSGADEARSIITGLYRELL
jgi:hypothetical protein